MGIIREYVFSIMIVSVSCAAVNMLTPENSGLSRYVHFLAALVVSFAILSPLQSLLYELPAFLDTEFKNDAVLSFSGELNSEELIINETVEILEKELKVQTENRLKCKIEDLRIICDIKDTENISITKIEVDFENDNKYLFSDTRNYLEDLMMCECEVRCIGGK
ncbi:MAG: stage III sporulation protein AF [Clostridia bacterium]|nr:stage III sporulation protein AF [Clostridia bacterium]